MDEERRHALEESRRIVASMTSDDCLAAARLLRDTKPHLRSDRQRELAEEMAIDFEARAAANA